MVGSSYLHNKVEVVCLFVCLSVCLSVCYKLAAKRLGQFSSKLACTSLIILGRTWAYTIKYKLSVCLLARARRARAHYQTYLDCQGAVCYDNEVQRSGRLLPDFARAKPGTLLVLNECDNLYYKHSSLSFTGTNSMQHEINTILFLIFKSIPYCF